MAPRGARMDAVLDTALNAVGFAVGMSIGAMSYVGYRGTGSPALFRMAIAFFAIGTGFFVVWAGSAATGEAPAGAGARWAVTLGNGIQMMGYFFIAFSHGIRSFMPRDRAFRSVILLPPLFLPNVGLEHIFKSVSFVLLLYGAIETILAYVERRNRGAVFVACGFALLAVGEFLGWYSLVFPGSVLYGVSVAARIAGLLLIFVPISRVPLARLRAGRGRRGGENGQ